VHVWGLERFSIRIFEKIAGRHAGQTSDDEAGDLAAVIFAMTGRAFICL
jgi:hypothetical protein